MLGGKVLIKSKKKSVLKCWDHGLLDGLVEKWFEPNKQCFVALYSNGVSAV